MSTNVHSLLTRLLPSLSPAKKQTKTHFAPVNIALIKYWGKRDIQLNLPVTDSLSVALGQIGTHTHITLGSEPIDRIWLNGSPVMTDTPFYQRTVGYLNLFRSSADLSFDITTTNDVPTGAGLASSASGYAALTLALNELFGWQLSSTELSIVARIGSGSACRSLWQGLVHWQAGTHTDGMDSYATPLPFQLPSLRMGLLTLSNKTKPTSSRDGMQRTQKGLSLYSAWPQMVNTHLAAIMPALEAEDIATIGEIAEHNSLAMHASMLSAYPALCYWLPETLSGLQKLWKARSDGLACWATLDAGPNIKLIFSEQTTHEVLACFPEMKIVAPFQMT